MGLFRVEFSGRGELAERQQKLGQHIRELVKIAAEFNVAVLVTNQASVGGGYRPWCKPGPEGCFSLRLGRDAEQ